MSQVDIKYTSDIQTDLKILMQEIEKIIFDLDPILVACKGRLLKIGYYHHFLINIEIRVFASKHCDSDFLSQLINRFD